MRALQLAWFGIVPLLIVLSGGSLRGANNKVPLVDAIKKGDRGAVQALLQQRVDVNVSEADGSTALHWAVLRDDVASVDVLLRAGANVKAANRYGVTSLMLACVNGNGTIVERLLKAGADVGASRIRGETALMSAVRQGNPDTIKLLLKYGAQADARESTRGQTVLMWAAADGNVDAMKVLIEAGADIHAQSEEKDYKKFVAPALKTIDKTYTQPEKPIRFTPLMFATRNGHLNAVKLLLEAGASPNETVPDGTSALVIACINGHWELGAFLLKQGANPNAAEQGWTALHQIARTRSLNLNQLPHPVPTGRLSPLDLVKELLAHGADVNARMTKDGMKADGYRTQLNRLGATPYLLAAKGVDHELMRLLLSSGADSKLTNEVGMTPLMVSAGVAMFGPGEDSGTEADALEAVKVALGADPDVNATDKRGHTALHGAAFRGAASVIEFLIKAGARLDAKIKSENFVGGGMYGDKGLQWTPLTLALGRQQDGKPIFLGERRSLDAAAILYRAMKERGMPINEDPRSIALLESLAAVDRRAPKQ